MQGIHYFQRYSQPENVATNNALLLLSRFYQYSPYKFSQFLNTLFEDTGIEPGIAFRQQEKSDQSVPDGSISQASFKVVIETKLYDNFSQDQLLNHCSAFGREESKVLLSLSPGKINNYTQILNAVGKFNRDNDCQIKYKHSRFNEIIDTIRMALESSDYEFHQVLADYEEYCFESGLIDDSENWMRAVTCGLSYEENFKYDLYYDPSGRGYSKHGYIGVYYSKAIRGVGKVVNVVTVDMVGKDLKVLAADNEVTDDQKKRIIGAMTDAESERDWDIYTGHKFFIVDKFIETDFVKETKFPLQGTKFFDLTKLLGVKKLPATQLIADALSKETW
jgi:hypothetical protein